MSQAYFPEPWPIAPGWGLELVTPATQDAITVADAADWLKVDNGEEDARVAALIKAAQRHVERATNRVLMASSWRLVLDRFPIGCPIRLPVAPVQTVTAVKYTDTAGVVQTLDPAAWSFDRAREPVRVATVLGRAWPATARQLGAVQVEFTAGYTSAALVPATITQAMRLLIGHWHENREAVVVGTINSQLQLGLDALLQHERMEFLA